MDLTQKLASYYAYLEEISYLNGCIAVLYQDMETHMPVQAADDRGNQIALLTKILHQKTTDLDFGNLISDLTHQQETLSQKDKRSLFLAKKTYDQSCKVPEAFIGAFEKAKSVTQNIWNEAKRDNNYALVMPYLKELFEMNKTYALYLHPDQLPYNTLLDIYEEGSTVDSLNALFQEIKGPLLSIITQALKNQETQKHADLIIQPVPATETETFLRDLTSRIGFDFSRGNIGNVQHPYETTLSPNDVRINTNYSHFLYALISCIHELGHGLYEQNSAESLRDTNLSGGVSVGMHESQSRLLENIIGRSTSFLNFLTPLLQEKFPTSNWETDALYTYFNQVKKSFIRTEADELTYNIHILIRFELEQALVAGDLTFEDLPKAWNKKMEDYLGIIPSTDTEGCLQDAHWYCGMVGYFPTYTIGNIVSAQLRNTFTKMYPDWESHILAGDFSQYITWFKEHIWQHGMLYTPTELLQRATGESLNTAYFLDYLTKKYLG